jgi:hypothetical protein
VNVPDAVFMRAEGFHEAVNAISRKSKYNVDTSVDQALNENVRCSH